MATRQRLVICLDGTWNLQDSSTNVLHHFNLTFRGMAADGLEQKKYYHRGVGTGVLDSITGGGFGFGLEQNVRDAYDWLVENYHEYDDGSGDEIYIFGFSRGAYTARSLVGFISLCGLLRRGAPQTVSELWDNYCVLGREKEERHSVWDWIFPPAAPRMAPIADLTPDPWAPEMHPRRPPRNSAEELLVHWSRRVRITYLGVYDTVGAIGWDALAIPGLTSKIALHNNVRPTSLIQHCRHALAIDEHRSSFNHTPFLAFVGHEADKRELESSGFEDTAQPEAERVRKMWAGKIEQCWFVGAHSNIGGGYDDNRLAQAPLRWLLDGSRKTVRPDGTEQRLLECEDVTIDCFPSRKEQQPTDSYAQFAPPLWTKILRAKPNYRTMCPVSLPQASAKTDERGFTMESIHETIHDTVAQYWAGGAVPPNLWSGLGRLGKTIPDAQPAQHRWLAAKWGEYVAVVLWASLAAGGLFAVEQLIGVAPALDGSVGAWAWNLTAGLWAAMAIALVLPLIDWSESLWGFDAALKGANPRERASLDALYWLRAMGFVLLVFGTVHVVTRLVPAGWRYDWNFLLTFAKSYWRVPVAAGVGACIAAMFNREVPWKGFAWLAIGGPAVAAAIALMLYGVGAGAHGMFPELSGGAAPPSVTRLSFAGVLLALQLSGVFLWRSLVWNAEPMGKANLGSIVALQMRSSGRKVKAQLDDWTARLDSSRKADPAGKAAQRMRALVREALWRDMLGFIPVYSIVLLFGLWFCGRLFGVGASVMEWWWTPVALVAAADYLEDVCHLRYCALHERQANIPNALAAFSFVMSCVKFLIFGAAALFTTAAIVWGTLQLRTRSFLDGETGASLGLSDPFGDWRAKIAFALTWVVAAVVLAIVAGAVFYRRKRGFGGGDADKRR